MLHFFLSQAVPELTVDQTNVSNQPNQLLNVTMIISKGQSKFYT